MGLSRSAPPVIGELGPWAAVRKSTRALLRTISELGRIWNRVKEKSARGISVNQLAVWRNTPLRNGYGSVAVKPASSCAVLTAILFAATGFGQTSLLVGPSQPKEDNLLVEEAAPALAFGRYLASLQERNPFAESGPICLEVEASIPGLAKQANLLAIRQTGTSSELAEYTVKKLDGDSLVKQQVIARYLAAEKQAERIPYSAVAITPTNYKFHYAGFFVNDKIPVYVFKITPRKKREGLIRGEIWIDSATGVAVHQAGRFVKRPSVFIRRIDVSRDTNIADAVPTSRVTRLTLRTRLVGLVQLTVTERPIAANAR